ncbi:CGNR zinc finger domain-containing protein [Brachybacterium sp. p3-SID957]|uniref:CGNR zinc finger domain-containing protein n=1 Tax=Brachybacterium sp. p3-SID957 TaxID=2916049 RepID=UPI0037BFB71C
MVVSKIAVAGVGARADAQCQTGSPLSHQFLVRAGSRGRNAQRRFCSLQCQNRAKSAAYRARNVDT